MLRRGIEPLALFTAAIVVPCGGPFGIDTQAPNPIEALEALERGSARSDSGDREIGRR